MMNPQEEMTNMVFRFCLIIFNFFPFFSSFVNEHWKDRMEKNKKGRTVGLLVASQHATEKQVWKSFPHSLATAAPAGLRPLS